MHEEQVAKLGCLPGSLGSKSLSRVWEGAGDLVKLEGGVHGLIICVFAVGLQRVQLQSQRCMLN